MRYFLEQIGDELRHWLLELIELMLGTVLPWALIISAGLALGYWLA
jgi:hypothetical protein